MRGGTLLALILVSACAARPPEVSTVGHIQAAPPGPLNTEAALASPASPTPSSQFVEAQNRLIKAQRAWIACMTTSAKTLAVSGESADVVALAATGSCGADEAATWRAAIVATGNAAYTENIRRLLQPKLTAIVVSERASARRPVDVQAPRRPSTSI